MRLLTLSLLSLTLLSGCQRAFTSGKPLKRTTTILLLPVYVQVKQQNQRHQTATIDTALSMQKSLLLKQLTEHELATRYTIIYPQLDPVTRDSLWTNLFTIFGEIGKQGHIRHIALPATVKKILSDYNADTAFGLVHIGLAGPEQAGYLVNTSVLIDRKNGSVIRYGSTVLEKQYPQNDSILVRLTARLIKQQVR